MCDSARSIVSSVGFKSFLIVELRDMYPLTGLFGEVRGNDHASGHLDIQFLIEPETIRIQQ
jgi:hypothetical protein